VRIAAIFGVIVEALVQGALALETEPADKPRFYCQGHRDQDLAPFDAIEVIASQWQPASSTHTFASSPQGRSRWSALVRARRGPSGTGWPTSGGGQSGACRDLLID
jgi:hypothetical protein